MTTQNRLTPQEELSRLPQWIQTLLTVRYDCECTAETARLTGHAENTVRKYWNLYKHLKKKQ